MSKCNVLTYRDSFKVARTFGDIWYDHAGNECFFREDGTISCRTINNEPSLTVQSERDKCDLNIIQSIYERTGIMNNVRTDTPKYGDFTSSSDYHDVVFRAQQAQEDFMALPASLRARFSNDPGKLLDFVVDPKNAVEAVSLGLIASADFSKDPDGSSQANQVPLEAPVTPLKSGV